MRVVLCAFLALAAGCATVTAPPTGVVGSWGGTVASLVLADSGGTLQLPCGAGAIDSAWTLSATGQFSASGSYFIEAGPVAAGGPTPHPAHYAGTVSGDRFTLTITVPDLNASLGPFVLIRNGPPVRQLCV